MKKILFLTSLYMNKPSANGICAKNITEQIKNKGYEPYIICFDTQVKTDLHQLNKEHIYTISNCDTAHKKNRLISKIIRGKQIIGEIINPTINKKLAVRYYEKAFELCKQKNIDTVVSMYFPLESVTVIPKLKKNFSNIKTIIYELDSVGDGVASKSYYRKLMIHTHNRWCARNYRFADTVIVMQSHEQYWKKIFGKKYGLKLKIADIPMLTSQIAIKTKENLNMSFVYAGLIEQDYRSPEYLLKLLKRLNKTLNFTFDFFSKGDCEDKIAEVAKEVVEIRQNGYVSEKVLHKAIYQADFLVSIGNSVSRSVPSKIITYISYGKPIIHFSSQKNDVCNEYFDKYPLALIIDQSRDIEYNSEKVIAFAKNMRGKTVVFSDIKKLYPLNNPAHSAQLIDET